MKVLDGFEKHAPFHQALITSTGLREDEQRTTTPIKGLNPTIAHFPHESLQDTSHRIGYTFKSRDNRKGRHPLTISQSANESSSIKTPRSSSNLNVIAKGTWRMFVKYPIGDISWWVAYLFVWGSIVWVLNAMFVFLPEIRPSSEFSTEILQGGGITAFIGATIFEVGSVLLILEAINEERSGCFGWAVEQVIDDMEKEGGHHVSITPRSACKHRFHTVDHSKGPDHLVADIDSDRGPSKHDSQQHWNWTISWHEFATHYIRELGFLACSAQLFGASVFWIAGLTALPGINNVMSLTLVKWIYWSPQVVGGSGFIISGVLFMLETQTAWYKPNFTSLGWHIGTWNLIGGIGFTMSGAFGYNEASWALYQSACSTFWGSFAFLIGSVLQLYESLEKRPVHVEKD